MCDKIQFDDEYFMREALRLASLAEDVALFARSEGLTAHAASATVRGEEGV